MTAMLGRLGGILIAAVAEPGKVAVVRDRFIVAQNGIGVGIIAEDDNRVTLKPMEHIFGHLTALISDREVGVDGGRGRVDFSE